MRNAAILTAVLLMASSLNSLTLAQTTNTSSRFLYSLPDRGGATKETIGAASSVSIGFARVDPSVSTIPTGVAIIGLRENGTIVSEAGVPGMTAMISGRTYAEIAGTVNTGVAFANPNSSDVAVSFGFTDRFGNEVDHSSFTLAANSQMARFLSESPFGVRAGFAGTFTFVASAPIGVIGLHTLVNERNEFLMTTQPVTPLPNPTTAGDILLAHFADGGGWRTQVILVNTADVPISGVVQFFSEGTDVVPGAPLTLNVNGQVSASFSYLIDARSSAKLETAGLGTFRQVGSVRVFPSDIPPAAYTVFSFASGGITVSQTTVQPVSPATAFRSFVEVNSPNALPGTIDSGIAIANNSSVSAVVTFGLTDLNAINTGLIATVTVPPQGHVSRLMRELFPALTVPFRGVLRILSSNTVTVVDLRLRYNERGEVLVTTIPVSNEASASTTAELLFPQIVDGGGFTTEFVLFSGISGQSSTGSIQFTNQSGQALNLTVR